MDQLISCGSRINPVGINLQAPVTGVKRLVNMFVARELPGLTAEAA